MLLKYDETIRSFSLKSDEASMLVCASTGFEKLLVNKVNIVRVNQKMTRIKVFMLTSSNPACARKEAEI